MENEKIKEIIDEIEAMANSIRNNWSDPRFEIRKIKELCQKLRCISCDKDTIEKIK